MYYRTQQEMNDVLAFGMWLIFVGVIFGLVREMITGVMEPRHLTKVATKEKLPQTKAVTVKCSICGRVLEIADYNAVTRSEALRRHIEQEHTSKAGLYPQVMIEGGKPLPPHYRYLVGWIDEMLPEYSLAVELLPAVDVETGERKIDAVLQQLKDGVETIQQSGVFRQFLITMSKFHDYSIGNQILIMLQKPDATKVAGFNTWKELGRWVKKGEKGIAILAPVFPARETVWQRRDGAEWTVRRINREWGVYITRTAEGYEPNTLLSEFDTKWDAEKQIRDWGGRRVVVEEPRPYEARFFKVVYVFALDQTEGKELPEFEVPVLTGEANEELFDKLLELTRRQGVAVSFESRPELPPEIKGQYLAPNRIWVRPEEPGAQQLKTLLHELAHYYSEGVFHIPRRDAETIAESAAFVIGAHYGFDTGVRSFPYVALWAQEKKVLEENLEAVRRVSTTILEQLGKLEG